MDEINDHKSMFFTLVYHCKLLVLINDTDIDECSGVSDCQQGCLNTPGSYNCSCDSAFVLDTDGRTIMQS